LPADKRRGAYALYAFCRVADDIVDEPGSLVPVDAAHRLELHAQRLDDAFAGRADDAVFRELRWASQRFGIPRAPFDELLEGVRRDLHPVRYQTWRDLEQYGAAVASSVGEMCLHVFGVADRSAPWDVAVGHARALGVAMQLTNVLRDVGEDAKRGRCYLPLDELEAHGLSADDVLGRQVLAEGESWRAVMTRGVERARLHYARALPGIDLLEEDARPCARACADGYSRILKEIERSRYDTFSSRASLGWGARLSVLGSAWSSRGCAAKSLLSAGT
jgi:phytoene synthase